MSAYDKRSQLEHCLHPATKNAILTGSYEHDNLTVLTKVHDSTSINYSVHEIMPSMVHDRMWRSVGGSQSSLDKL
jgi:hypothetical protein